MIEKIVLTDQEKMFVFQMNKSKGEWKVEFYTPTPHKK